MATAEQLDLARQQIEFSRDYTLSLLAGVDSGDWFRQPREGITHLAWQVGHLAMAEYGLCLYRVRGRRPEDGELMSSTFRKQFSKGSLPIGDTTQNPAPDEVRGAFDRVHAQVLRELASVDPAALDDPVDMPYAVFPNKLGGLFFCAAHEMLHAGQIGLLRRLLGHPPLR